MMNKKITILVLALAVIAVVLWCWKKEINQPVAGDNKQIINQEQNNNQRIKEQKKDSWEKYYNKELGIEFMYPKDYLIKTDSEIFGFDAGKKRDVHVISKNGQVVFSLFATSKDYAVGVGEGCCFYYSNEPLNTKLDLDIIVELISDFEPINFKKVVIDNHEGVRFYSLKSYISIWAVDSILLPYNKMDFTNLLITSPTLQITEPISKNEEEVIKKELVQSIKNKDYLKDNDVAHLYDLFNQILKTLKFID